MNRADYVIVIRRIMYLFVCINRILSTVKLWPSLHPLSKLFVRKNGSIRFVMNGITGLIRQLKCNYVGLIY